MKRNRTVQSILRATFIPALLVFAVILCSLNCTAIRAKAHAVIPAVVQTNNDLLLPDDDILYHLDFLLPVIEFLFILLCIAFLIRKTVKNGERRKEGEENHAWRLKKIVRCLSADPEKDLKKKIDGKLIETPATCPNCGAVGYADERGLCKYCGQYIK